MKFYLISDNVDTLMGMHLAGIDGVVVHEDSEVRGRFLPDTDTLMVRQTTLGKTCAAV